MEATLSSLAMDPDMDEVALNEATMLIEKISTQSPTSIIETGGVESILAVMRVHGDKPAILASCNRCLDSISKIQAGQDAILAAGGTWGRRGASHTSIIPFYTHRYTPSLPYLHLFTPVIHVYTPYIYPTHLYTPSIHPIYALHTP